jgi:hypothetical protein
MDRGRWADACGDRTFRLYRRVPSSPEEHPAPHLRVTNVAAARDIGLAWLAGRTLSPLTDMAWRSATQGDSSCGLASSAAASLSPRKCGCDR